jgi:hypothetical protein
MVLMVVVREGCGGMVLPLSASLADLSWDVVAQQGALSVPGFELGAYIINRLVSMHPSWS